MNIYEKLPYKGEYSAIEDTSNWLRINGKKCKRKHVFKLWRKVGFFYAYDKGSRKRVAKMI